MRGGLAVEDGRGGEIKRRGGDIFEVLFLQSVLVLLFSNWKNVQQTSSFSSNVPIQ